MLRVLRIVLVAAAVVAVAWWVSSLSGTVSVTVGDLTWESGAPVAVLAAAAGFLVLYGCARLIAGLMAMPRWRRRRRHERDRRHGDRAVTGTLLALAAGDTTEARREAGRARRLLGDTPQTLLLAAEAGRLAGDAGAAAAAFRALAARPDAAFLGYRGLLRQAMERGDWTEAARLARSAEAANPGAAWLRDERRQLAIRTGAWAEALALASPDAPKAALTAAAADAEADPSAARRLARKAWLEAPGEPAAALAYARRLREGGAERKAVEVIGRAWALAPTPALADFLLAPEPDPARRLALTETLGSRNTRNPESLLLIARTALEAGNLSRAREAAETARGEGLDERRLWMILADIAEASGDEVALRDALRRAATAAPDAGWRCEACGAPAPAWTPACAVCDRVGTVAWRPAPVVTAGPPVSPVVFPNPVATGRVLEAG